MIQKMSFLPKVSDNTSSGIGITEGKIIPLSRIAHSFAKGFFLKIGYKMLLIRIGGVF